MIPGNFFASAIVEIALDAIPYASELDNRLADHAHRQNINRKAEFS